MLSALCHVDFHVTGGQRVECIYSNSAWDGADLAAIAFHSFPDTLKYQSQTGAGVYDSTFSFRLRLPSNTEEFVYGFVFCHQRYDSHLPRGGEQVSIVALSSLPLSEVFIPLVRQAGPLFLLHGSKALESIFNDASKWPRPLWGVRSVVALQLGNDYLHVNLPSIISFRPEEVGKAIALSGHSTYGEAIEAERLQLSGAHVYNALPPLMEIDLFTPFVHCLSSLWHLWEMVLLGEPLLIMAPTPQLSSSTVQALLSITAPYPYGYDFRPYFTVHDPSFTALGSGMVPTQASQNLPSLLGITNPHIRTSLSKWPNTIVTGFNHSNLRKGASSWPFAMVYPRGIQQDSISISYKACVCPDLDLVNTLMLSFKRSGHVGNEKRLHATYQLSLQLQQHFRELTSAALRPLLLNDKALRSPASFRTDILDGAVPVASNLLARFKSRKLLAEFYDRWLQTPPLQSWLNLQLAQKLAHSDGTIDVSVILCKEG